MIVLKSPKGWTGPKFVDGMQIEGTFRAHQIPLLIDDDHPGHLEQLETWLKSYRAEELFDETGKLIEELEELAPIGELRMGANPNASGGLMLKDLIMPDFIDHVMNKKASIVRVYLPPDANCWLSEWDHCPRSRYCVNVVIAGKYKSPQCLSIGEAAMAVGGRSGEAWLCGYRQMARG